MCVSSTDLRKPFRHTLGLLADRPEGKIDIDIIPECVLIIPFEKVNNHNRVCTPQTHANLKLRFHYPIGFVIPFNKPRIVSVRASG